MTGKKETMKDEKRWNNENEKNIGIAPGACD